MMIDYSARQVLSKKAQVLFDDITEQRVLGASAHIKMICTMFEDICNHARLRSASAENTIQDISRIADFFKKTRGEASQAISNAIHLITQDLNHHHDLDGLIECVNRNIASFEQTNQRNLDLINEYALSLVDGMQSILLFDYSSTVGRLMKSAGSRSGQKGNSLEIFIPESRVLDGGKPYLHKNLLGDHKIRFIPDIAIYHYLKNCDGVFIGAETYYTDGRVFNTVGSEMIAYLCKQFNVPFYVLTTLIKIDIRAVYGYQKPMIMLDLKERIAGHFDEELKSRVDFTCPEFVEIPSEYITAFVTEKGILPTSALFHLEREYENREISSYD